MKKKKRSLVAIILALAAALSLVNYTPTYAAAYKNTSTKLSSGWIESGPYKVILKNENLMFKKNNKNKTTIESHVPYAFLYGRDILYRSDSTLVIYNMPDDTRRSINLPLPTGMDSSTTTLDQIQIAGFSGKEIYYLAPRENRQIYCANIDTNVVTMVSDTSYGTSMNAFISIA